MPLPLPLPLSLPFAAMLAVSTAALAQRAPQPQPEHHSHQAEPPKQQNSMPGMQMDGVHMEPGNTMPMSASMQRMMQPRSFIDAILNHTTAGTSAEPVSTPMPMLMRERGTWMLMLHGSGFVADTQQSGPRGGDKFFATNWIMPMAQRPLGRGQITLRTMLSLEPATITGLYYPELFQQGETARGVPIRDGQHPHNFWMEVAALYDLRLGGWGLLSAYAAPVGDPAIGPTAYPHRWSASENPIGTLGHHQQDSTHIAYNVLTLGITAGRARIEASGFHGEEPNEKHWRFEPSSNGHAIDSWATRFSLNPTRDLSTQYSFARITRPEAQSTDDQVRQTASVLYNRHFGAVSAGNLSPGNLAVSLLWGRTKTGPEGLKQNSYTAEALYQFRKTSYVTLRMENAARTSELVPGSIDEKSIGHVAAYTAGFDHDVHLLPHALVAPGVQVTAYRAPDALAATHRRTSVGVQMFVRFRLAAR